MTDSPMKRKELLLKDLLSLPTNLASPESPLLQYWQGPEEKAASFVAPAHEAAPGALVFASTQEQLSQALAQKAAIVIAHGKLTLTAAPETAVLKSPNVGLAMSLLLPYFDRKSERFDYEKPIHPTAYVHATAQIGAGVRIGPFAVIGARAVLGANSTIGAHTVIEMESRVGERTLLHPQVFVGAHTIIGNDCEIHPHTTIGSDGFGYARDREGRQHKLPQLGRVVIGDRVEIGANCAIDRAAFKETRIGDGSKLDNLCHIGHNVELGRDGVGTAGLMIAGSSKVGDRFATGGMVAITDHVTITNDVMLAGRATVTNDVPASGAYGGHPLIPVKDHLKVLASSVHLPDLRRQMAKVLKALNLE